MLCLLCAACLQMTVKSNPKRLVSRWAGLSIPQFSTNCALHGWTLVKKKLSMVSLKSMRAHKSQQASAPEFQAKINSSEN